MDERQKEQVDKYLNELKKYPKLWKAIELKIVAKKEKDFYNVLGMKAILLDGSSPTLEVLLDINEIIIFHIIKSIEDPVLMDIMGELKNNALVIDDLIFKLDIFSNYVHESTTSKYNRYPNIDLDWPSFELKSIGNRSMNELVDENKIKNQLHELGYESFEDACVDLIGFQMGGSHQPIALLIAPIYIITSANFKDNSLALNIKFHKSLNIKELSISYSTNEKMHKKLEFTSQHLPKPVNSFCQIEIEDNLPSKTKNITFFLLYKRELIWKDTIYNPFKELDELDSKLIVFNLLHNSKESNRTISSDEQFRRNLCMIDNKSLSNNKGVPRHVEDRFELAILNLLGLAGYAVLFLGKGVDTQGIDIVAFSQKSDSVLVVSCTVSNNIGEKIRTILPQINRLKKSLRDFQLIPAIFTPIDYDDIIATDKTNLAEHRISIIHRFIIEDILKEYQTISSEKLGLLILKHITDNIPYSKGLAVL